MEDGCVTVSREEYDVLRSKAEFFDRYIETEELTKEETEQVKKALKGRFITKDQFLKKHSAL